nr:PREDICTED: extracellular calcium-sensing receptor-like [Latimeria chalumnae]|eukprot:XP_006011721.1 PREDICTED: extracellular calcium-sensing receptor-like [Latimeria chalumnae]
MIPNAILILLIFFTAVYETAQPGCRLPRLKPEGYFKDGDIIIGAIMPIHYRSESNNVLSDSFFTELRDLFHCEGLRYSAYQQVHTLAYTIEEINYSNILPNVTLGFRIYDDCVLVLRAIEGAMWLVTGQEEPIPNFQCESPSPLAAIIGTGYSMTSIPVARLLGLYHIPQISYSASVHLLSDKQEFPSFFRTIPSDEFQSIGLAHLAMYFDWKWVGLLSEDTDFGKQGIQVVKQEILQAGGCIAFSETLGSGSSTNINNRVIEVIKSSSANVIVVFATAANGIYLEEIVRQNITGKVWLASDGWSTGDRFSKKEYLNTLSGTLALTNRKGKISGFQEHLFSIHPSKYPDDIFIKEFWENAFDCKWPEISSNQTATEELTVDVKPCTGEENLKELDNIFLDLSNVRFAYNTYTAVYSVAHALRDMYTCKPGEGPFVNRTCANIRDFEPWQLLHYVKNVHFTTSDGMEIHFDKNGDPVPVYDIINWQITPNNTLEYVTIGSLDFSTIKGKNSVTIDKPIMWNGGLTQIPRSVCSESCLPGYRKALRSGQPVCCFDCILCSAGEISNHTDATDCLKCPEDQWSNDKQDQCIFKTIEFLAYEDAMGSTLATVSIFCALTSTTVFCIFIKYRNTPIVKANNCELSYLLLLALVLCFLSSLVFIGKPRTWSCMLRQVVFGIIFALSVSCVLAKTIMVVIAFNATKPNSNLKKWVGPKLSNSIVFVCTVIQIIICIGWLASAPPFATENMKSQIGMIIIECNEGSTIAFWCVLGYMGLLAIVSFIVAFLARNLPDSFNEAKFITFSMLVFVSVWLAFIPAYLSTKGKYMVAVEIFAILVSSAGLLACIFVPKCYIILLKPDMNTRESLMGKGKLSTKNSA